MILLAQLSLFYRFHSHRTMTASRNNEKWVNNCDKEVSEAFTFKLIIADGPSLPNRSQGKEAQPAIRVGFFQLVKKSVFHFILPHLGFGGCSADMLWSCSSVLPHAGRCWWWRQEACAPCCTALPNRWCCWCSACSRTPSSSMTSSWMSSGTTGRSVWTTPSSGKRTTRLGWPNPWINQTGFSQTIRP